MKSDIGTILSLSTDPTLCKGEIQKYLEDYAPLLKPIKELKGWLEISSELLFYDNVCGYIVSGNVTEKWVRFYLDSYSPAEVNERLCKKVDEQLEKFLKEISPKKETSPKRAKGSWFDKWLDRVSKIWNLIFGLIIVVLTWLLLPQDTRNSIKDFIKDVVSPYIDFSILTGKIAYGLLKFLGF